MSKSEAVAVIRRFKDKTTGRVPIRYYWCRTHDAYHVTSKPKRKE